ncbi:hypothetical protein L345_01907, partial [Ophiophagus hannah]
MDNSLNTTAILILIANCHNCVMEGEFKRRMRNFTMRLQDEEDRLTTERSLMEIKPEEHLKYAPLQDFRKKVIISHLLVDIEELHCEKKQIIDIIRCLRWKKQQLCEKFEEKLNR